MAICINIGKKGVRMSPMRYMQTVFKPLTGHEIHVRHNTIRPRCGK